MSMSVGHAGGSSCSGRGGHFQPPAPLSRMWKQLLRDLVRAPDSLSCPEEASGSELAQEGFLFLWAVLCCVSSPGGLSCPVSVSSPGGLLIPPNFPREFFFWGGGVERVPAVGAGPRGPRPRPQAPPAMASWAPCTAMASWAPCTAMASVVCSRAPTPERPPPLPGGTVTAWDTPSGRGELCQGSVVCVMCSRLLCPYLVCFLSLFNVIIS